MNQHLRQKPKLQASEIGLDAPLRLAVAAALAYPDGSMTAHGLRKEARRGRLKIERTAGKDYTTLGAIKAMRELCRQVACGECQQELKAPTCGSERPDAEAMASAEAHGSSSIGGNTLPQAALRMKLRKLKESSANTSLPNTPQRHASAR